MPPTARLPTAEFRSLLLAPIRVRLRTLHSFTHPQCARIALHRAAPAATCLVQRRSLHLYKTARAKTALGMHKVLDFDLYKPKPPSESPHRVNLVKWQKGREPEVLKKNLSLQELYEHVSPGNFLFQVDQIPRKLEGKFEAIRDQNIAAEFNNYAIGTARSEAEVSTKNAQTDGKQLGALKNIIMLLSNPVSYKPLVLDRAYQFIELGSPVEFRIRLFGSAVAVKNRGRTLDPEMVPWLQDHFPHMRPDFILKAMPEGSVYLIEPVTDGRIIQFVVCKGAKEMPKLNLTTRLFRVQGAVEKSLPNNPMAQRYMHNKVKRKGGLIGGGARPREMTEDEKERQKQILEAAKEKNLGRLTIPARLSRDDEDPDEDAQEAAPSALRLGKGGVPLKKPRGFNDLKPKHRWGGRGSTK